MIWGWCCALPYPLCAHECTYCFTDESWNSSSQRVHFSATSPYLPSFPFFPFWCFKSPGCLFISHISSAQRNSSSPRGRLWSPGTVQNNNNNSNNSIILLFSSNVPFFWCFSSFYKGLCFSSTSALYFSNNTVAYFICTALNWVMAMPWANLQKCCSYLPRAEAGGEPAVLPFLFLLHKLWMLELGQWEACGWGANSCSVWQPLSRADGNLQWLQESCCLNKLRVSPTDSAEGQVGCRSHIDQPRLSNPGCWTPPGKWGMHWSFSSLSDEWKGCCRHPAQHLPALHFSCMKTQH